MTIASRYRFFRDHGGGIVGESALTAITLARAEEALDTADDLDVAHVTWTDDPEPWDEGTEISAEEAREKFASNEWTGPYGAILYVNDESHDSLWGIVVGPRGTNDPYCRVIAAEIASQNLDAITEAINARMLDLFGIPVS